MPPEPDPTPSPGSTQAGCFPLLMLGLLGAFLAGGMLFFLYKGVTWLFEKRTGEAIAALSIPAFFLALVGFVLARKRRPPIADVAGPEPEPARLVEPVASPAGVETTPLPGMATLASHRISRPGPDVIALVPGPGQFAGVRVIIGVGVILVVLGLVGVPLGIIKSWPGDLGILVGGLFLSLIGFAALLGIETHQFDRRAGVYLISSTKGTEVEIPLRSIRGVQIVTDVPREVEGRYMKYQVRIDQLNLVLRASKGPRRNLVEGGDREAIQGLGRLLADFLGVDLYRDSSA